MDTDDLSHMYAEIAAGGKKADSTYIKTDADGELWDSIAADCDKIKAEGGIIDMVDEIPDAYAPTGATES